jgi:hypothetical protein
MLPPQYQSDRAEFGLEVQGVIDKHIDNLKLCNMPSAKQYYCDCSQHCKGRRILVHRSTYQRHAPFRQADLDKRLSSASDQQVGLGDTRASHSGALATTSVCVI